MRFDDVMDGNLCQCECSGNSENVLQFWIKIKCIRHQKLPENFYFSHETLLRLKMEENCCYGNVQGKQ